jgi:hypothetical protein
MSKEQIYEVTIRATFGDSILVPTTSRAEAEQKALEWFKEVYSPSYYEKDIDYGFDSEWDNLEVTFVEIWNPKEIDLPKEWGLS